MTDDKQGQSRKRKRLMQVAVGLAVVLAALIVPPMVNVSRYKSQITQLVSSSLRRQVRLGSVKARLLPLPGFTITDLTVEEDPRYGSEPTLHANTVRASIRLFSLWRGRLEIGSIHVDEASLNVVRTSRGWNVDELFRTAASQMQADGSGPSRQQRSLPSLSASNSRINLKNGAEKLPFSLVNTTLSLSPQQAGTWRFQLKGQPARTDLRMELGDTGTLRLEGTARGAADLRSTALKLDLSWREAQLGQLSRLLVGADPGWRGALTGDLHLEGTPENSQIKARLRAVGVHRAEFAPDERLDFDANCALSFHALSGAYENLACESPIGGGRVRLTGENAEDAPLKMKVELDKLPVQAVLGLVRTVRSGFGEGLAAAGSISGQMSYAAPEALPAPIAGQSRAKAAKAALPSPLTGAFTVDGFKVTGKSLGDPVEVAKVVLTPAPPEEGRRQELAASVQLAAGASAPLTVAGRIGVAGYRLTVRGPASLQRASQLAQAAGMAEAFRFAFFTGDALQADLSAEGPWLSETASGEKARSRIAGSLQLHNLNWKSEALVRPLQIASATVRVDDGLLRWDPVEFALGPLKGSATIDQPMNCPKGQSCLPRFRLEFAKLDVELLQAALLGAEKQGTLLSELIARLRPEASRSWPRAEGTVHAVLLQLGPVMLKDFTANVRMQADRAELDSFDGSTLGGAVHGKGTVSAAKTERDQPSYQFSAELKNLTPVAVGMLMGQRFSGDGIDLSLQVEASGYRGDDLAKSAKGLLHLDWRRGAMAGAVPPALTRFDQWKADWEIAGGALKTSQNEARLGTASHAVRADVSLELKPKLSFTGEDRPK